MQVPSAVHALLKSQPSRRAVHPGRILLEEVLVPAGISQNALARSMRVPPRRVNEIVLGKRSITPASALLLAEALGFSAEYWMALQVDFDLQVARQQVGPRQPSRRNRELGGAVPFEMGHDASRHEGTRGKGHGRDGS